jgi:hypothetical protein
MSVCQRDELSKENNSLIHFIYIQVIQLQV